MSETPTQEPSTMFETFVTVMRVFHDTACPQQHACEHCNTTTHFMGSNHHTDPRCSNCGR